MRCYICDTTSGHIFVDPQDNSREICQKCFDAAHENNLEEFLEPLGSLEEYLQEQGDDERSG